VRVKKADGRKRIIQRRWVILAWMILAGEVLAAGFTSPLLVPRLVVAQHVRREDVPRAIDILKPTPYGPLLQCHRRRLQAQFQKDPRIERADVAFRLPMTLRVSLSYRQPFIAVTDGVSAYLVDRQLVPYLQVKCMPAAAGLGATALPQPAKYLPEVKNLPVLQAPAPLQVQLGKPLTDPNLRVGCEAITLIENEKLASQVQAVVDPEGNICLNIGGGAQVRLGSRDRLPTKIATLKEMLRRLPSLCDGAEYVDLTEPNAPVRKPKSGAQAPVPSGQPVQ
jgi:cell division septal protein FtsQ